MLKDAVFDLDASVQSGRKVVDSVAKMEFSRMQTKADGDGVKYFDLTNSYLERKGSPTLQDGQYYTHAYVLKWRASDSGYRTLFRHNSDHCAAVKPGTRDLGVLEPHHWSDSGYDISPQQDHWDVVVVTGAGESATSQLGVTTFYTLDAATGTMQARGTSDRVCSGKWYYRIGYPGQGPGKIARVMGWDRVLRNAEIEALGHYLAAPLSNCT